MVCENTISAGFNFMLGKFLFDLTVIGGAVVIVGAFWLGVAWFARVKK